MDYIGSSSLGPTLMSDPESLDVQRLEQLRIIVAHGPRIVHRFPFAFCMGHRAA